MRTFSLRLEDIWRQKAIAGFWHKVRALLIAVRNYGGNYGNVMREDLGSIICSFGRLLKSITLSFAASSWTQEGGSDGAHSKDT